MKKLFFIAAIASAALVSCTKNELAPSATEQQEISFLAPVVGPQTKVYGAIGATYNTSETFDVWAVHNTAAITEWGGTTYINDVKATYDSGVKGWRLENAYYWPATGLLSFVALSPSIDKTTTYDATNGFKITDWSQGASEATIVDLMYSNETRDKKYADFTIDDGSVKDDDNDATYIYNGVDIQFNHALSYLVFNIKTKDNYSATTNFRLNAITLSGVYTTGSFTQIPEVTSPVTPNWKVDTDASKVGTYKAYTGGELTFGVGGVSVPETEGKEIILLPQTLAAGKQKMTIAYQISTDGSNWIDQTQVVDLCKGSVGSWEMGKKYTYTISISMTEILLDPAVSDWTPDEDESINL